jgi:hypothetical protein
MRENATSMVKTTVAIATTSAAAAHNLCPLHWFTSCSQRTIIFPGPGGSSPDWDDAHTARGAARASNFASSRMAVLERAANGVQRPTSAVI